MLLPRKVETRTCIILPPNGRDGTDAESGLVQKVAFSGIKIGGRSGSKPTRRMAAEHRDEAKNPRPEMG
jgi:hypothetical protein